MGLVLFIDGPAFSLRMGQFSNPVATHPRTNEVEVPPPHRDDRIISKGRSFLVGIVKVSKRGKLDNF